MGRRCIAPNCTSGYDSNKERCHFFNVPRHSVPIWQEAIPRHNFVVKPGQAVCEKHFRKEDILWSRKHVDASGNIFGWTEYKIPRLKRGAIPTLFGGHPCVAPTFSAAVKVENSAAARENLPCQEPNNDLEAAATSNEVVTRPVEIIEPPELKFRPLDGNFRCKEEPNDDESEPAATSNEVITKPLEIIHPPKLIFRPMDGNLICKEELDDDESEPAATSNEVIPSPIEIIEPPEQILPPLERAFSFDTIFTDDTSIDLPSSWSRRNITSPLGLQAVQFSQWTCRKEGKHMRTTCLKEIVIGRSLIVGLYVIGHSMNLEKFSIPAEPLSSTSDLEKIVKVIDELKVCFGCLYPTDNFDIETESTYKDNAGQVRHKNCPLLLHGVKTCEHCQRGRSTLQSKRRRLESGNNMKRVRIKLSPSKKMQLDVLRRKLDNVGRSRRRALAAANRLKASLQKCQTNISKLRQKTVKKCEISPNKRTA